MHLKGRLRKHSVNEELIMKAVTRNVWNIAQESELLFGDKKRYDSARFIEAIHDKYVLFTRIKSIYPQILKEPQDTGKALEMGIGPLCLGVVSLLEPAEKWEITGIDPLPRHKMAFGKTLY